MAWDVLPLDGERKEGWGAGGEKGEEKRERGGSQKEVGRERAKQQHLSETARDGMIVRGSSERGKKEGER